MKSRRWFIVLGCLLVLTLALTAVACGGGTSTSGGGTATTASAVPRDQLEGPQGPQSSDTPQYGGTLIMLHDRVPTNIGVWFEPTGFADVQMARYAIENLVGLDPKGLPIPQLATSWDIDNTAKTITFHLRQGVKFQDETAFDATACKWNLDKFKAGPKGAVLKNVSSIDIVDPYTIKLTMTKIDPDFFNALNSEDAGRMISPTAYQTLGDTAMKLHPVGTGPFMFDSYTPNVSLKYKKFPDYWQKGLPYLDGVEIRFVSDSTVALTAFKNGEAQVLYDVSVADAADLKAAGDNIHTRLMTLWGIAGDSTDASCPFSKLAVRQGISYAINREANVGGVYEGFNVATDQLAVKGLQGYNDTIAGYPYDQTKAAQLLTSAGITPATPWNVTFTYVKGSYEDDFWTLVQQDLAKVGINLKLNGTDYAGWMTKAQKGAKNELVCLAFSYNGFEKLLSGSLTDDLSPGRTWYPLVALPDDYIAAYNAVMATTTSADREAAYEALQKVAIQDDCIVVPLLGVRNRIAVVPSMHDYGFGDTTTGEFLPERAWMTGAASTATTAAAAAATTTTGQ